MSMFIILCSFDNYQSLENLEKWLNHINNVSKNFNKTLIHFIPIVILVNKNDLKITEKKFKFSDVNEKIKNLNYSISVYPFSAKENNTFEVFKKIEFLLNENNDKTNNTNKETLSHTPNGTSLLEKSLLRNEKRKSFKLTRRNTNNSKDGLNKSNSCCL